MSSEYQLQNCRVVETKLDLCGVSSNTQSRDDGSQTELSFSL